MYTKSLVVVAVFIVWDLCCIFYPTPRFWSANLFLGNIRWELKDRPETLVVQDNESHEPMFASIRGVYSGGRCVGVFGTLGNYLPGKIQAGGVLVVDTSFEARFIVKLGALLGVGVIYEVVGCVLWIVRLAKRKWPPQLMQRSE